MTIATILLCSTVTILGMFAAAIDPAWAQDQTPSPPLTTSGFVDVFYNANLGRPADHANTFRNFDVVENRFDLALTEIVIQKSAAPRQLLVRELPDNRIPSPLEPSSGSET